MKLRQRLRPAARHRYFLQIVKGQYKARLVECFYNNLPLALPDSFRGQFLAT